MSKRRPDYELSVKAKDGAGTTRIGAGWLGHDGSINITLNPCVVLDWRDPVFIKLFPPSGANRDGYPKSTADEDER